MVVVVAVLWFDVSTTTDPLLWKPQELNQFARNSLKHIFTAPCRHVMHPAAT
jgi:hypothetical protein